MPPAPAAFDMEMGAARGMAEYRAGMPDFGMGKSTTTSEPRTAREVGALVAFSQAGITERGMSFREPVREIYEQAFELWWPVSPANIYLHSLNFTMVHFYLP